MSSLIERVRLHRLEVPLLTPYRLAFGVVDRYETIVLELIRADGRIGFGEATILDGYSDETIDQSWTFARSFGLGVPGTTADHLIETLRERGRKVPFAATAFGTAAEMLNESPILSAPTAIDVPLVGLLSSNDEAEIEREFEAQYAEGYRTLKVKVGFDWEKDSRKVKTVQRVVKGRAVLRLDANQGYTAAQGVSFVRTLDPSGIELFEQPCAAGDWDSHLAVVRQAGVPMMLDESIHGLDDIDRAASLRAATHIKVKLMKCMTVERLIAALCRIKEHGMTPVLGNGVACDLGCWMEACVASRHIDNAGEMNGFLKTRSMLLSEGMTLRKGALHIEAGFAPTLDSAAVSEHCIERDTFS